MTERKSQVFICMLATVFVLVPVFVIKKTVDLQSGWNGLAWESTQDEVKEWVKKITRIILIRRAVRVILTYRALSFRGKIRNILRLNTLNFNLRTDFYAR